MWWLALCVVIVVAIITVWYYPELLLTPLNSVLRLDTSVRTNFYSSEEMDKIFPAHLELEAVWEELREEGYALYNDLPNKDINYLRFYHMDVGKEDKQNWTTIPLRIFGQDTNVDIELCPLLSCLLLRHKEIKSCMFSIMQPGKEILPHHGPYDGLLRYQLALDIPRISSKEECYLHVAGEKYSWTNGEGVMFDESNLHGAVNFTKDLRMVLLVDVERPYDFPPFRLLNNTVVAGMGALPATKKASLL